MWNVHDGWHRDKKTLKTLNIPNELKIAVDFWFEMRTLFDDRFDCMRACTIESKHYIKATEYYFLFK